jgi:hypothetical protein
MSAWISPAHDVVTWSGHPIGCRQPETRSGGRQEREAAGSDASPPRRALRRRPGPRPMLSHAHHLEPTSRCIESHSGLNVRWNNLYHQHVAANRKPNSAPDGPMNSLSVRPRYSTRAQLV